MSGESKLPKHPYDFQRFIEPDWKACAEGSRETLKRLWPSARMIAAMLALSAWDGARMLGVSVPVWAAGATVGLCFYATIRLGQIYGHHDSFLQGYELGFTHGVQKAFRLSDEQMKQARKEYIEYRVETRESAGADD